MCKRDLGDLGETVFKGWCHAVGLTVHKVEKDRTGWDFLVEFPWKQESDLPKDMLLAPIECKVQIKSTDKRKKRNSITVSNLSKLVKNPLPVFFCFIEFDGKNDPQAAYLVHIDREIIKKTLKRIRELETGGDGDKLNKHTIDICYTDEDRLPNMSGENLKNTIEKYVSNGLEKYIEHKNKLLENLGFEEGKGQINITLSCSDHVKKMIDLSLGLREEIYIRKSVGYRKRFGILSDDKLLNSEGAILNIEVTPIPVILKFKKEYEFSFGVSLNAELYTSPFNQSLPEEYHKFRVKSQWFELVVEPFNNRGRYSFDFRDAQRISLNDLKNHLEIFTLLKKTSHPLTVEISDKTRKMLPILFEISANDEIEDWSDVYEIAKMALSICQKFSILETDVLVTIDELIQASYSIRDFYKILNVTPKSFHIDFPIIFSEYQDDKKSAYIFSIIIVIGNHTIVCFGAIIGFLSLVDVTQHRLVGDEIILGSELIAVDNEVIKQDIIDRKFNEFEQKLTKLGFIVITTTL